MEEGRSREEAEGLETPWRHKDRETEARRDGKRERDPGAQGQPDLSCTSGPGRTGKAASLGDGCVCGGVGGVQAGSVSSQVPTGDGRGQDSYSSPTQIQGLSLLTQPLPPSDFRPGRSC